MDTLINFLILIVIFAIVAYGLWWVCVKFGMPQPVLWLVGAILLIIMLLYVAGHLGRGLPVLRR